MEVPTGEFRALSEQVNALADQVADLQEQAFILRTLEEVAAWRAGYGAIPPPKPPRPDLRLVSRPPAHAPRG